MDEIVTIHHAERIVSQARLAQLVAIAGSVASVLLWLRHRRGKNR
ncbi:hypothetical protein [Sphaerisporangium album]|nr:hypothetical protein [Sphaerisporangium album]